LLTFFGMDRTAAFVDEGYAGYAYLSVSVGAGWDDGWQGFSFLVELEERIGSIR